LYEFAVFNKLAHVVNGFRNLAVASAATALVLAVLGSWVRINGAGMTCPDWPLCRGSLVPQLSGGIVLEWSHRALALLESVLLVGTIAAGRRVSRCVAGVTPALGVLIAIFVAQVLLGGATVHLSNSPLSVMLHWAAGTALLATLTTLAILAVVAPSPTARSASNAENPMQALAVAAGFGFLAMCIGSYVSSSYAGLACASFPDCAGTLLGNNGEQHLQMLHRLAAGAFALAAFMAVLHTVRVGSPRVKAFAIAGMALLVAQIGLGAFNVALLLPVALREAHAANACLTFLAFVIAAVLAAIDPLQEPRRQAERGAAQGSCPS
jgi:heme A synthase